MHFKVLLIKSRAVTTIEADEATASSDFLKKKTEREREKEKSKDKISISALLKGIFGMLCLSGYIFVFDVGCFSGFIFACQSDY